MNVIDQISMDIEELEATIAPDTGLSACLTTAPGGQGNPVHTSVGDAAVAADGHGVVTVVEGTCTTP